MRRSHRVRTSPEDQGSIGAHRVHVIALDDRTAKLRARANSRRLDMANRTDAVSVALRQGIVALEMSVSPAGDAR